MDDVILLTLIKIKEIINKIRLTDNHMTNIDLQKQTSHAQVTDQAQAENNSTGTLIRQIDSMIQRDMSGENKLEPMVGYFKLASLASG